MTTTYAELQMALEERDAARADLARMRDECFAWIATEGEARAARDAAVQTLIEGQRMVEWLTRGVLFALIFGILLGLVIGVFLIGG
jgi:hypothetical protein